MTFKSTFPTTAFCKVRITIRLGMRLRFYSIPSNGEKCCKYRRGEYLYAACGTDGLRVFDIAFIDHKGFSQRITTAPVSPLGQQFYVKTTYATAVAAPATLVPDPTRTHDPKNFEQPIHELYGYLYVADREEGLILVGAGTLLDGNPLNNFLKRDVTFNPNGILKGAKISRLPARMPTSAATPGSWWSPSIHRRLLR